MAKITDDPGPLPDGATPQQREAHRRAEERFLTENFKEGASKVPATVNSTDFAALRSFFGLSGPSPFDFNNDNLTNSDDFAEFRKRFGITLP